MDAIRATLLGGGHWWLTVDSIANIIVTTALYALIAVGLSTIYGVLRVLHIAHAAVYAVGAWAAYEAFVWMDSFWLALVTAMAVAGIVGVAIYYFLYRPLLDSPRAVPLLASIGAFIAIEALLRQPFLLGPDTVPLAASSGFPELRAGSFRFSSIQLTIIIVSVVAVVGVYLLIHRTRTGLAWRAITQDRQMASSVGINLNRSITLNFLVGSALAGLAAMLAGVYTNSVSAGAGAVISYKAFVIVVLGGLGNVPGAVLASLLLATTEIVSARYVGTFLPRDAIAFLVLIAVLLVRPEGLTTKAVAR